MNKFGFEASKKEFQYSNELVSNVYYVVNLPHQCDEWTIAYSDTLQEAEDLLLEFIKEAQEALEQLRNLE